MPGKSNYQRLTGRRRGFTGFSQLWLAPDHILLVQNNRFSEQYRRFALADIQAIVVTTLPDGIRRQGLVAASLLWTAILFAVGSMFWKIFFGVTGAMAIAVFVGDIARGPRCRCHLYTAVSRELLAPVSRVRGARAFLDRIRPAIDAVQGTLAPERIATLTPPGRSPEQAPPEVPAPPGYLPEILFALFLIDAAFVLASTSFARAGLFADILPTTFFAEFVILVVALIRRPGRDPRRFIYALMAVAIVCMGWDAVAMGRSFADYMGSVFEDARRGKATPPTVVAYMAFRHAPAIFAASWRAAAGIIGLAAAFFERQGTKP